MGAAGIVGIIKTVLCLEARTLAPTTNCETPNPAVPWERLGIQVVQRQTPWLSDNEPRVAGVHAYALTGSNAHVVVEEAPPKSLAIETAQPVLTAMAPALVLPLSAKDETALRAQAHIYAELLSTRPDDALADITTSTALHRSALPERPLFSTTRRSLSQPCSPSSGHCRGYGTHGASNHRFWLVTASESWWRRVSQACSRWRTACDTRRQGPSDGGSAPKRHDGLHRHTGLRHRALLGAVR
ncbi:hypothetical protein C2W62_08400 [Candidatus Entotheonella serta]|nr:hypothetical protein C2W62_08400 [Candidatus Entotheonella serta]